MLKGKKSKRKVILDFIENNAKKSEFINWLNAQYDVAFSEKSDWGEIKTTLLSGEARDVKTNALQIYAASLTSEEDVKDLLESVEEEAKEAKHAARKLFYLSKFKKFSIAIGGAILLEGAVFLILAIALFLQLLGSDLSEGTRLLIAALSGTLGIINLVAGLLLATR